MNTTTQGLAVATALMLSAGMVSAMDLDHGTRSKSSTAALPWRTAPTEMDSFAGVVAASASPDRAWASPQVSYTPPQADTFETDPARRGADRPPAGGDVGGAETNPAEGLVPVPEPHISSLLLAGVGVIGLIGLRRRVR